jgi:hypothetical protein
MAIEIVDLPMKNGDFPYIKDDINMLNIRAVAGKSLKLGVFSRHPLGGVGLHPNSLWTKWRKGEISHVISHETHEIP